MTSSKSMGLPLSVQTLVHPQPGWHCLEHVVLLGNFFPLCNESSKCRRPVIQGVRYVCTYFFCGGAQDEGLVEQRIVGEQQDGRRSAEAGGRSVRVRVW